MGDVTGQGLLVFGGAGATFGGRILGGVGVTVAENATLKILNGNPNILPDGSSSYHVLTVNGTLDLNGFSPTVGKLQGSGVITSNDWGVSTLTVGNGNQGGSFAGQINDNIDNIDNPKRVGLKKVGSASLLLSGDNTYSGGTTILEGTLEVSSANSNGIGNGNVINNASLVFNNTNPTTVENLLSGTGIVYIYSNVTFTAENTYTGGTVNWGTLQIGNDSVNGRIAGDVTGSGTLVFGGANSTFGGRILGNIGVTVAESATLKILNGNPNILPDGSNNGNPLTVNGTLDLNGFSPTVGELRGNGVITSSGWGVSTLTVGNGNRDGAFDGQINDGIGTVALTKTGTNQLVLRGENSFTGETRILAGTLVVEHAKALRGSTLVYNNDEGSLSSWSSALWLGGLAGTKSAAFPESYGLERLFIGANGADTTFSGYIAAGPYGDRSLIKIGAGSLTLSGQNVHTGGTVIAGGTLRLGCDNALPTSGTLQVGDGENGLTHGVFDLSSHSQTLAGLTTGANGTTHRAVFDEITGALDATLTITNSVDYVFDGCLTGAVNLHKQGTGQLTLTRHHTTTGDATVSDGTLTLLGSYWGNVAVEGLGTLERATRQMALAISARFQGESEWTASDAEPDILECTRPVLSGNWTGWQDAVWAMVSGAITVLDEHGPVYDDPFVFPVDSTNFRVGTAGDLQNTIGSAFSLLDGSYEGVVYPTTKLIVLEDMPGELSLRDWDDQFWVVNANECPFLTGGDWTYEGAEYSLRLDWLTPPQVGEIDSGTIDWGDGQTSELPTASGVFSHVYADGGAEYPFDGNTPRTIELTLQFSDGTSAVIPKEVIVRNVPPTIAVSGDDSVVEDASYTLELGLPEDLGDDEVSHYYIHWGDELTPECYTHAQIVADGRRVTHAYAEPGVRTIVVDLADEDGTYCAAATKTILVRVNGAPQFTSTPVVEAFVGETYRYESKASDPENDALTYGLPLDAIVWPSGYSPSAAHQFGMDDEGVITWSPPVDLVGQTVTISEVVTDASGNRVSRPITIVVRTSSSNHNPMITSAPPTPFDILRLTEPQIVDGGYAPPSGGSLGAIRGQVWLDVDGNGTRATVPDAGSWITLAPRGEPVAFSGDYAAYEGSPWTDDGSSLMLELGFLFEFFGGNYTHCHINNNGNITFKGPLSEFTPKGFPQDSADGRDKLARATISGRPMIAPFWSDVDTRGGANGTVYVATGESERGNRFIQIEWVDVGYYPYSADDKTNSFTLYIENDSAGDVVAFIYGDMEWTTGTASNGLEGFGGTGAQIGFDAGDGVHFQSFGAREGRIVPNAQRPNSAETLAPFNNTTLLFRIDSDGTPVLYSEPGIDGFLVQLVDQATGEVVREQLSQTFDLDNDTYIDPYTEIGLYCFDNLPGDTDYTVRVIPRTGWVATETASRTAHVVAGQVLDVGFDFGQAHLYHYQVEAFDPDGDVLHYQVESECPGVQIDAQTGELHGFPTEAGTYEFIVSVTDGRGGVARQTFTLEVKDHTANASPHITSSPHLQAAVGRNYSYTVRAFDANLEPLTFSLTTKPDGMEINPTTGVIIWQPTADQVGASNDVTLVVRDSRGGADSQTFTIDVIDLPANVPPRFASSPVVEGQAGTLYYCPIEVVDLEGNSYSISLVAGPPGMALTGYHGDLAWEPTEEHVGQHHVTLAARDDQGGVSYQSFTIDVLPGNRAPRILSTPDTTIVRSYSRQFQVIAVDADGDSLTYECESSTDVVMSISDTGLVTYLADDYNSDLWARIIVKDPNGGVAVQEIAFTYANVPLPTYLGGVPAVWTADKTREVRFKIASGYLGSPANAVALGDASIAAGASLAYCGAQYFWDHDEYEYSLTWTPPGSGFFPLEVNFIDSSRVHRIVTLPLEIIPAPSGPPLFTSKPVGPIIAGNVWNYQVIGIDPDVVDGQLIVDLLASPAGCSLVDGHTLQWTPNAGDVGDQARFIVRLTDASGTSSTQTFELLVVDQTSSTAPRFVTAACGPAFVGQPWVYEARAIDPDGAGALLAYELMLDEYPEGMALEVIDDAENGRYARITWTPQSPAPLGCEVRVKVTDGSNDVVQTFHLPVLSVILPLAAPAIVSAAPNGATIGEEFVYEPVAVSDASSPVQWFLETYPDGMVIDRNTGRITWTPREELLGRTVDIRLVAANSTTTATAQTLAITVGAVNRRPTIDCTFPKTWQTGQPLAFDVMASDPEGHELSYALSSFSGDALPSGVSMTADGGFEWQDPATGRYTFLVKVAEKHCASSYTEQAITLQIVDAPVNSEPIVVGNPHGREASVGHEFTYRFSAFDLDTANAGFSWSIEEPLTGVGSMSIDGSGLFAWTPEAAGTHTVTIRVDDNPVSGCVASTFVTFTLTAIANAPPVIAPAAVLNPVAGTRFTHHVKASDPDGGPVTFAIAAAADLPQGISIDRTSGRLDWNVPRNAQNEEWHVPVVVTDQHGATALQDLHLTVLATDTIAPAVQTRMVEVDAQGNILAMLLPGESLDMAKAYALIVDISDNSGAIDESLAASRATVIDVATLEDPGAFEPVRVALQYGVTWIDFMVGADGLPNTPDDGLNQGNIHFEIAASDEAGNRTVREVVYYVADTLQSPEAKIEQFREDENPILGFDRAITGAVDVWGIAHKPGYTFELILYRADGKYYEVIEDEVTGQLSLVTNSEYVVLASGVADSGESRSLGTIDPTLYGSGMYRLVLAILCDCGERHYQAVDERIIEIRNDVRPGNLELSFTDLEVDLGGIAVSLARTYSSTQVALGSGDFGPGWSLNFLQAGIQLAHFQRATNSLQQPMAHGTRVLITLPDGTIERFTFAPQLAENSGLYVPYFRPDPDVFGALEVQGMDSIALVRGQQQSGDAYVGPYVVANSEQEFVPALFGGSFVFRAQSGLEYLFDTQTGKLTAIQDDTGHRIDISTDGSTTTIDASSGTRSISIERGADGRITRIVDPSLNEIDYAYGVYAFNGVLEEATANLGMVTLRDDRRVFYRYTDGDFEHHLTEIYDHAAVRVLQASFDEKGQLAALTDASGKQTDLACEMWLNGQRIVTVTSESGAVVNEVYDSRGHVLRRVEALDTGIDPTAQSFVVTAFKYDMSGRLLGESSPFMVIGASNRYTQTPTTWARSIAYDAQGRMLSSKDALGNTTAYAYDRSGRLIATTDATGAVTHNVYDPSTGVLRETYRTQMGSQTKYNHLRYEYDWGQLTASYRVDPDGQETLISSSQYTNGRLTSTTDASDVTRYYVYDANGNQTVSYWHWQDHPTAPTVYKTLISRTDYDADGRALRTSQHEVSSSTVAGHVHVQSASAWTEQDPDSGSKFMVADVEVTYPAIFDTRTVYEARGQVGHSVDRHGIETHNIYDARGNVIETRTQAEDETGIPGWLVSRTVYDSQGRVEFAADPYFVAATDYPAQADVATRGTRTVYDLIGRVKRTEQHEGVVVELVVDPNNAGQKIVQVAVPFGAALSATETVYDDQGRVAYTLDEYGARTEFAYDLAGRQIQSRYQSMDENGTLQWVTTRTIYDPLGRPVVTSDPFLMPAASDPLSLMPPWTGTRTTYDALGRAAATERVNGLIIHLGSPDGPAVSAASVVWSTETVYNAMGQVDRSIGRHAPGVAGPVTTYQYDAQGRQIAQIGPAVPDELTGELVRHRTETHYGAYGRVDYTRDNIRVVVVDGVESIDDTAARTTYYEYDAQGQQTAIISTAIGDPTNPSQTTHVRTETVYDAFGRQVQRRENITQDDPLDPTTIDATTVRTTHYVYDAQGRLVAVVLPAVQHPSATIGFVHPRYEYSYDAFGHQVSIRDNVYQLDPLNSATIYYDHDGAAGDFSHDYDTRVTRFSYNAQGQETSRTLPLGVATASNPDDFVERKFCDDRGQLDHEISFEGVVAQYVYSIAAGSGGRLVETRYFPDITAYANGSGTPSEVQTYTYDAYGREVSVVRQAGGASRTTTTGYDSDGRVVQIASPEGTVNYRYDAVTGARTRTFTGTALDPIDDTHYSYDLLGRLIAVTVYERNDVAIDVDPVAAGNQPEATRYAYHLTGNLHLERKANGVVAQHAYDALNRLDTLTEFHDVDGNGVYAAGVDTLLARFDYDVGTDGRRSSAVEQFWLDGQVRQNAVAWTYDDVGRLTKEVFDHYDNSLDQTEEFVYDLASNRLRRTLDRGSDGTTEGTTTYAYDANDRLTDEWLDTDGLAGAERVTTYGYNETQETLREVRAAGVLQSRTQYTYNLQGRMETATVTTYTDGAASRVERSTYAYDATGIRVAATVAIDAEADGVFETSTTTEYLNDPQNATGYSQVLAETTTDTATGALRKRIVYTLGHDRLSQTTTEYVGGAPQPSETLFFGHDGHGSTRVLFDALGAVATLAGVAQVFHYTSHGSPLGFDASAAGTTFLYSGEQTDATGLQYLRARYYNPSTGRFNRLDPFAGNMQDPQSLHKYLYCHGDPVNGVDPSGLYAKDPERSWLGTDVHTYLGRIFKSLSRIDRRPRFAGQDIATVTFGLTGARVATTGWMPDLVVADRGTRVGQYYEIKRGSIIGLMLPHLLARDAAKAWKLNIYGQSLAKSIPEYTWTRGKSYLRGVTPHLGFWSPWQPAGSVLVTFNDYFLHPGVLLYDFIDPLEAAVLATAPIQVGAAAAEMCALAVQRVYVARQLGGATRLVANGRAFDAARSAGQFAMAAGLAGILLGGTMID